MFRVLRLHLGVYNIGVPYWGPYYKGILLLHLGVYNIGVAYWGPYYKGILLLGVYIMGPLVS